MNKDISAARDITKGHYGKYLVYFPSRKNKRQMVCESELEADYCLHLEHDKAVINYRCQPETLAINIGNKIVTYTPDFCVETLESTYFVEVKHNRENLSSAYQAKLCAADTLLQNRHISLHLIDAIEIRKVHRLENLQLLYSRSFRVKPDEYLALMEQSQKLPSSITLGNLLEQLPAISCQAKYLSIFNGLYSFDWDQAVSLHTCLERFL
ncbi:Tn7 transposase TnsA N-terminal domain-containing protein [Pseudomonas sp. QE6]|uniref:Tn7 transposase TnsA N-terminal domain-containing protein n=1 Tax=Pseudomonas sp. QE6 TaxID=3242491 RepID=UPI003528F8DA